MTQINERTRRRDKDAVTYAIAQEATNSIAQTLANLKRNGLTQTPMSGWSSSAPTGRPRQGAACFDSADQGL